MFETTRIVYINIDNAFFTLHKERELKVARALDLTLYGQECELGNGEPDYPQN
ncbi:MAG TPA: hypothetical protein VLA93_08475 [Pyrinomonadaceae bacterium]|nr:hypothetical protein [Pyrinomonadaceae bacterium]